MPHAFFGDAFAQLHVDVFDYLASSSTIHAALPLLGVSRYWRQLTIRKLVRELTEGKRKIGSTPARPKGEYIKVRRSTLAPMEGAHKQDDPRFGIAKFGLEETTLVLTHFDPKTLLCTFKALRPDLKVIPYDMPVNEAGEQWADIVFSFDILSSAWFRPATENKEAIYGLELAGRPNRFPVCELYAFTPEVVKPKDIKASKGKLEVKDEKLRSGLTISWQTVRTQAKPRGVMAFINGGVPVNLSINEIKIPLIDVFCPRRTSAEKGYYPGYGRDDDDDDDMFAYM